MTARRPRRSGGTLRVLVGIVSLFALSLQIAGAAPSAADVDTDAGGARCEEMTELSVPDTEITAGELVPAGDFVDAEGTVHRDLPEFCRVAARVAPSLNFEVWMPTATWNERFLGVGNGGFAGNIRYDSMAPALAKGYATASTDTGHSKSDSANSWISNPAQLEMWGRTSIHLMTLRAKQILTAYHEKAPKFSYFEGGSTGGRQAMGQAEFFPDDYDGIVSHSPGMDYSHVMMAVLWTAQRLADRPKGALDSDDRKLLNDAVLAACGGRDGVASDPFLNDPRDCHYNVKRLECRPGTSTGCLTAEQVRTAEHVYTAVTNQGSGEHLYPGFAYGSEAAWNFAAERQELVSYPQALFGRAVFDDPEWDWRSFDWDEDVALVEEKLSPKIDPTRADLSKFDERGGKLIMTQGWSDPFQSGSLPIEYYTRVLLERDGSTVRSALRDVQEFYRLFMIPGGGHVTGGMGPNSFDALSAVRAWVEQGIAPKQMVATKYQDDRQENRVVMTRPLCPYPQIAGYDGAGPTTEASSFRRENDWGDFAKDVAREKQRMQARERSN
ncbi:tannase/feruloyl esterase family alpha/beta hydrolase [Nocardioides panzhihuensis]|uniref:Feruloyl esterase n=1 Tax=Nocardioides panzhihuensis TaxID=860243 RepID=A0A7Z0DLC6_9ACTN|nr:tannase/feruloyl esterase family alpha/beta hydrolase [Nocardioides panzhihuensis]NYI77710.1 feruloyl esterase [Nocardioides panzhihuensis]